MISITTSAHVRASFGIKITKMAAYYGKSRVFDPRFLARKAKLDSINSISRNPHGWTSILGKLFVDSCFPLRKKKILWSFAHHSTSRSNEQSAKRRSHRENMGKVYSQNNKIVWLSNEIHEVHKGLWAFFLIVISGCWLAGQKKSDHMDKINTL